MSGRERPGVADRYLLLGATLFLALVGLVMIFSAASVADIAHKQDAFFHLKKQVLFLCAGFTALAIVSRIDYRVMRKFGWPVMLASMVGLVAVHFMGVGKWGAQRWISIGGMTIQPSEYAKLGALIVGAEVLAQWRRGRLTGKEMVIRLLAAIVPVATLVMLQPDMGTTMSIVIGVYLLLWMARVDWRYLTQIAVAGMGLVALMIAVASYRMERFLAFLKPWEDPQGGGYQIIQATLAFGSGGLTGLGLGMSRQKFFYLPAAHTDFIFAIIGEELGLLGTLAIVSAFGVFTYAGIKIAMNASDHFGRLLAGGLTAMIATQAVINMAAVTGLMPITGIPLPLVSYGGSSLTLVLACIGIIMSVQRHGGVKRQINHKVEQEPEIALSLERRRDGRPHLSSIDGGRGAARKRA